MNDMLNYDPNKRPTASQCLQYPFFQVRVPIPINAPDFTNKEKVLELIEEDEEEEKES